MGTSNGSFRSEHHVIFLRWLPGWHKCTFCKIPIEVLLQWSGRIPPLFVKLRPMYIVGEILHVTWFRAQYILFASRSWRKFTLCGCGQIGRCYWLCSGYRLCTKKEGCFIGLNVKWDLNMRSGRFCGWSQYRNTKVVIFDFHFKFRFIIRRADVAPVGFLKLLNNLHTQFLQRSSWQWRKSLPNSSLYAMAQVARHSIIWISLLFLQFGWHCLQPLWWQKTCVVRWIGVVSHGEWVRTLPCKRFGIWVSWSRSMIWANKQQSGWGAYLPNI